MNDLLTEDDDASTPLTEEERGDLIPSYITLRPELNEAEQRNILEAEEWAFSRGRNVLSDQVRAGEMRIAKNKRERRLLGWGASFIL